MTNEQHTWTEAELDEMGFTVGSKDRERALNSQHPFHILENDVDGGNLAYDLEDRFDYISNLITTEDITCIFFLDKSARPAAWLFKDYWLKFHSGKNYKPMPDLRFINYGREKKGIVTDKDVRAVQEIYKISNTGNIVVIDEFGWTGTSLEAATELITKAYPDRKVFDVNLEQQYVVALPSAYKGVKDRTGNSDADRLLVEKHPQQSKSQALRKLLRKVFGRARK